MNTITDRINNTTLIQDEYLAAICPAPKSVKIELTSRCNFKCGFCSHRDRDDREDMDFEFYKDIVHDLKEAGVMELGLFYIGESFLYPKLAEAISYAKQAGIEYVFLTTNGSLMDKTASYSVMDAGLDSLKVSFNNYSALQFRDVTGLAMSSYEKIIRNIKEAYETRREHGFKTKLYASSILYDGKQRRDMEDALLNVLPWVDEHYWLPLYSFGGNATQKEMEMGYYPTRGNTGVAGANQRAPIPCWAVFKEGHITVHGLVSACCFDTKDQWLIGDMNKTNFMTAWNSAAMRKIRRAHLTQDLAGTACELCLTGVSS